MTQSAQRIVMDNGRLPVAALVAAFDTLGWTREEVAISRRGAASLPILSYRTLQTGPAVWIISGIHGEEPAGPSAIAASIDVLQDFGHTHPMVLLPLCNPLGYAQNWRYLNRPDWAPEVEVHSVGDSEHVLPGTNGARMPAALSAESQALIAHVLKMMQDYPPCLTIDLHEDDLIDEGYIYSQGTRDDAALKIIDILSASGIAIKQGGETRFGETITRGMVRAAGDGSIDELLAAKEIIVNGRKAPGPASLQVIVVETPAGALPLSVRCQAQANILKHLKELLI